MEKCYEYLGCDKYSCTMRNKDDDVNCWELEDTLCHHPNMELMKDLGKGKCEYCIYYKFATVIKRVIR